MLHTAKVLNAGFDAVRNEVRNETDSQEDQKHSDSRSEWETQDEIESAAEEERPDIVWKMEELRAEIGCKTQY